MAATKAAPVSLVLCAKNGDDRLTTCLQALAAQNYPGPLETIVVDNGSDEPDAIDAMASFVAAEPHRRRMIREVKPGNSAGRNAAIRVAKGDLVVFIDADCYAAPDLVSRWVEVFAAEDVGYGTGRIARFDPRYSSLGCVEQDQVQIVHRRTMPRRGFLQGSNMAFRREALQPFDERFGAGVRYAGEDFEMSVRLTLGGWNGGYFPKPSVAHDHRRPESDVPQRRKFYDYGAGAVYAKYCLGRHGPLALKKFLGDARRLQPIGRSLNMLRGFVDYSLTGDRA